MPPALAQDELRRTVLDRLLDEEPDVTGKPAGWLRQNLREFQDCVLRDVHMLLNTRRSLVALPEGLSELEQSVWTYGLPDFTSAGVGSEAEREQVRQAVELALARFEPRLRGVRVTMHPPDENNWTFRLSIAAELLVDPEPLPLAFDAVVKPSDATCTLETK